MIGEGYFDSTAILAPTATLALAYLIGGIPFAYIIVRLVTNEDVTVHGTGNVGAMNVRRSTGSWKWFTVAMIADACKGLVPVTLAKVLVVGMPSGFAIALSPWASGFTALETERVVSNGIGLDPSFVIPMLAVAGAVLGHNYSVWMALLKRRFARTGKGLATGGGALLAYDWRYFLAALVVGLAMIAVTRYMMAGQVAAAASLPVTALLLRSADWPFALVMGAIVYVAHHRRFMGLLAGREPKLYVTDSMGPRG